MPDQNPAQIAYEAYAKATDGLTYDGRPMPAWADLGDRIQHAWAAAALALGIERDMPSPAYGAAWTELTGYVQAAIEDGAPIEPTALAAYMRELKRRALTPVRDWIKRTAEGTSSGGPS